MNNLIEVPYILEKNDEWKEVSKTIINLDSIVLIEPRIKNDKLDYYCIFFKGKDVRLYINQKGYDLIKNVMSENYEKTKDSVL